MAKKKAEPQRGDEGFVEPELTDEQVAALGEGRTKEKDRVDKKPAKATKGPGFESETPSALALEKVGADGDGEAYQAEKRKHRWG
jgi:hypothetical protein